MFFCRSRVIGLLILLVLILGLALPVSAEPLDEWQWRNPLPQGNELKGITYGGGIFVTVGGFGSILTSADGTTWTGRNSETDDWLFGITYGNGTFVAVGESGTILTSPDGVSWTASSSGTTKQLRGVTYDCGIFVAVGESGTILTSPDGISWTDRSYSKTYTFYGVTCGNDIFVAVGDGAILTSLDGITWTDLETDDWLFGITSGNGTFVAVGESGTILTSPDGVSWTASSSGTNQRLFGITYGGGIFVAVGDGAILTSLDGKIWTSTSTTNSSCGVIYGGVILVAVGGYGRILTSPDGTTWTERISGTDYYLLKVTYGSSTFVAVGYDGTILTSPDGASWTASSSGTTNWLSGVTYGGGTFVAVGYGAILTSPDGTTWTARSPGEYYASRGVTYGNGTFVAVSGSNILTSPDGVTWTVRSSGSTNLLLDVVTYGGTFVVVGTGGTILTSTDGATWTVRNSGTTGAIWGVTYGSSTFVAVGDSGNILTSPDGASWTASSSGTNIQLFGITYCGGTFGAVGQGGTILTSTNGNTWTARNSGTANGLYGLSYGSGTFVAVGEGGTILQSGVIGTPPVPASITINGVTEGLNISEKTSLTATVTGAELTKVYYYLVDQANHQYNIGESYNPGTNWLMEIDPSKYSEGTFRLSAAGVRKDNGEKIYNSPINIVIGNPPSVIDSNPKDGALDIDVSSKISVIFSEELDGSVYKNVTVKNNENGDFVTSPMNVYVSDDKYKLIIERSSNWSYSTNYTVTIPIGIVKDKAGISLANEKVFSFSTIDRPITIKLNDVLKDIDPKPFRNKTTGEIMVPYQFFVNFSPTDLYYDNMDDQITLFISEKRIIIDVPTNKMDIYYPDKEEYEEYDCTVVVKDGNPFVSLRTVAESCGAVVEWFENEYLAKITYTAPIISLPDLKFGDPAIEFDNEEPFLPNELRIKAKITNVGQGKAMVPVIKFLFNGKQFYEEDLDPIDPGQTVDVKAMWQAGFSGENGIMSVRIELSEQEDDNPNNNLAIRAIQLHYVDFRHDRDAFKFENWVLKTDKEYIDELNLWLTDKAIPIYDYNIITAFNALVLTTTFHGHCAGMARASTNWYIGPSLKPTPVNTFQMDNSGLVKAEIIDLHFKQYFSILAQKGIMDFNLYNANKEYETIINHLNNKEPVVITLRNTSIEKFVSHAVVAYKALDLGNGYRRVFIYDNNFPYEDPNDNYQPNKGNIKTNDYWIEFGPSEKEVSYDGYNLAFAVPAWQHMRGEEIVANIKQAVQNYIQMLYDSGKMMFGVHSPVSSLVMDENGKKFGFYNGNFVNEIPGADLKEVYESEYYYLPLGHTYKIEFSGTGDGVLGLDLVYPTSSYQANLATYTNIPVSSSFSASTNIGPSTCASEISTNSDINIKPDYSGEYKAIQEGDVNGDNTINVLDLLWMAQYIGKKTDDLNWENTNKADVNADGIINILDLLKVAKNML